MKRTIIHRALATVVITLLTCAVPAFSEETKTEATMVHLRCIHDTMEFLDDRQLALVLEMSEAR
jgi:hypothetical protein